MAGFLNNFQDHRRLSEQRHRWLSEAGTSYLKRFTGSGLISKNLRGNRNFIIDYRHEKDSQKLLKPSALIQKVLF
jgi:hypothetical protein